MKKAILLLACRIDYAIRERYEKLLCDCGGRADVYLLFDATRGYDEDALSCFERVFTFDVNELIADGYKELKSGILSRTHYPVLAFHAAHPEYDTCWIVEDDAIFSGDWSILFDAFDDDPADLVAAYIRSYYDEPTWVFWGSIRAYYCLKVPRRDLYACFIPVFRLSSKAMDCLEKETRKGWRGHIECVVPTVLSKNGLTMRDMNGKGFGLDDGVPHQFYSEESHTWTPLRVQAYCKNMIYHPIKEQKTRETYRRFCLLSVAGAGSRHACWLDGDIERDYDVHLVVYDLSFGKHCNADFVYYKKGRVWELVKDYFDNHDYLLRQYDYFLIMDEKSQMNVEQINSMFEDMAKNDRDIFIVNDSMPCLRRDLMLQAMSNGLGHLIWLFEGRA